MKSLLLWLAVVALTATGCGKKSTGPEPEEDNLLATQIIGSSGGELAADDFSLIVPPGAFAADTECRLYGSRNEHGFEKNAVSGLYRVDGLPTDRSLPLTIRLKYSGELSGDSYLAIGAETFIISLATDEIVYHFTEASDSSGYLCGQLTTQIAGQRTSSGIPSGGKTLQGQNSITVVGVSGECTELTENFTITYNCSLSKTLVSSLVSYLEDAYDTFVIMGFDYDKMSWPMKVAIYDLSNPTVYGFYELDSRGLVFNEKLMSAALAEDIQMTSGREFFYTIPYHYIPLQNHPWWYEDPEHLWFYKAISSWSEEKFAAEQGHIPMDFTGNELAAFDGLFKSDILANLTDVIGIGAGMAPLVKYLVDKYDRPGERSILCQTIEKLAETGWRPGDALVASVKDTLNEWLPDFFKEYISGNIYDVAGETFTTSQNLMGTFEIESRNDTLNSFSFESFAGSASVFEIRPVGLMADSILEMGYRAGISPSEPNPREVGNVALLFFGSRDGKLEHMMGPDLLSSSSPAEFKIDAEAFIADGFSEFYVVLVYAGAGYAVSHEWKLQVAVSFKSDTDFKFASIVIGSINYAFSYDNETCGTPPTPSATSTWHFNNRKGSVATSGEHANQFVATWKDTTEQMELTWITTGTMYVSPLPGEASFTIEEDLRNPLTGCGSTTKISGLHIPNKEPEYGEVGYGINGTGTCPKLTIEYIQDCPGRQCNTIITPNSLKCDPRSWISIELW